MGGDAPEYRQFDFWLGTWTVRDASGQFAGTNRIETILGGCALAEHWTSARGSHGRSLTIYSPREGAWHQTWADDQGTLLRLDGAFTDGAMVLRGTTPASQPGSHVMHQITWSRIDHDPDRVRQEWVESNDGGTTWSTVFDGRYIRGAGPDVHPVSGDAAVSPHHIPEYRQFDFWLGAWDVFDAQGQHIGTNRVVAILSGYAIQEHWTDASGGRGTSISMYDVADGQWHQTWVDDTGTLLRVDGAFADGKMTMTGVRTNPRQPTVIRRITWSVVDGDPDRVLHLDDDSADGGATWRRSFHGLYVRRAE